MTQAEFYNKEENQKETTQLAQFYNVDGTKRNNNEKELEFEDYEALNEYIKTRNNK